MESMRRKAAARTRVRLRRHLLVGVLSAALVWFFWSMRSQWVAEMRLWKAVGDASFILLVVSLSIGPVATLFPSARRWLRWRRQLGIWFALTAALHGTLVVHGWARWSLRRFLGYEDIPQLGREVRLEPGFGLANLIGLVALVLALVLAATSSDFALRRMGRSSWRWLHRLAHTILVLTLLHGGYFLYIHYTESFHKAPLESLDWFRVPFLVIGLSVVALHATAFVTQMPMAVDVADAETEPGGRRRAQTATSSASTPRRSRSARISSR